MKKHELDKYADLKTEYGAHFVNGTWKVNLWHPIAQKIEMIIFDKDDSEKEVRRVEGKKEMPNFTWSFDGDMDGMFYQFKITQQDGKVTHAMDPFAKSMAAFNWEGRNDKVGKAAFVKVDNVQISKLNKINEPQPIIYEAHVRDLTSLSKNVTVPGSFNALKEIKLAEYLHDLGITHLQMLPIHNCYTLNEMDKRILGKGEGSGWKTNYNWGYDPHNYFSINGWYSTDPENPYSRINEFRDIVKYFHNNKIKVILDVVYNHMYDNSILDNLIPGYYYRDGAKQNPVNCPPFASNRLMVRRIIIESLKHFVEHFDVDGFRFDLSTFTDKETLEILAKELRGIKPNLVLHGEAWNWTDLEPTESFNKECVDNDIDFAYFNDTTRNAIKGEDDGDGFAMGIVGGNMDEFPNYVASIVGNIMDFKQDVKEMATSRYHRWTNYPNNALNYTACHDGHTMWDKVNLTARGTKEFKLEMYRQAIMLQQFLPGRTLFLEGTELLYTKPNDKSGQDGDRSHKTDAAIDLFGLGTTEFNENTYKTTDYSTGVRWEHLNEKVKNNVYNFIKEINWFRQDQPFFNMGSSKMINKCIKFNHVSKEEKVIDFNIAFDSKTVRIIHNFSDAEYKYESNGTIKFDSKLTNKNVIGVSEAHSSILIRG